MKRDAKFSEVGGDYGKQPGTVSRAFLSSVINIVLSDAACTAAFGFKAFALHQLTQHAHEGLRDLRQRFEARMHQVGVQGGRLVQGAHHQLACGPAAH